MKKTLTVLVNEIVTVISRPSFWFTVLGMPLIAALVFAVIGWINQGSATAQALTAAVTAPQQGVQVEGYVDASGIIQEVDGYVPPDAFIAYPDEASALAALEAGEIAAYYLVPADFLASGDLTYIRPDFNPLAAESGGGTSQFTWLLQVNLMGGDALKASLVNGPLEVQEVALAEQSIDDEPMGMSYWVPYAVTLILYILIMSSSSLLLSNISKEKENRIIEVLLTSITPMQMLTGKILGLGIIGLGQALLWLVMTSTLLNRSQSVFQLAAAFQVPPEFILWGVVYFILGYVVYASLMAGLGALAPNLREASQATFIIMIPLMIPMVLGNTVFAKAPHGNIATFLSLFPLTAPVGMMARLSVGGVPAWQPWVAMGLLVGTVLLTLRAVAGMFRAQSLLSGQGFNVKKYLLALVGRG